MQAKLYKAMLDGLEYRGTAFFPGIHHLPPERGVSDNMSADQAKMVRDSRGMPEFVYNPRNGETSQEAFDLNGNRARTAIGGSTKFQDERRRIQLHPFAHWALTEGRFRKHVKSIKEEEAREMIHFDDMLVFHHPG